LATGDAAMGGERIRINEAVTWLEENAVELKNKLFDELKIEAETLGESSPEVQKHGSFMLSALREMHTQVDQALPIATKRAERVKMVKTLSQFATTILSGATVIAVGGTNQDIPRITAVGSVLTALLSLSVEWLNSLGYGTGKLSYESVTHELIDAAYEINQIIIELAIYIELRSSDDKIRDLIGKGNVIAKKMSERTSLILGKISKHN
jgi:hypothetical protein